MTEEALNTLQCYLVYLSNDLMKRIPLDYWTLVVLISNMERVTRSVIPSPSPVALRINSTRNLIEIASPSVSNDIIKLIEDIYTEAIRLLALFVKTKPENGDLLMAVSALPEDARKTIINR